LIRVLQNNRGIALILTILVVSLIIAFTIQFNRTMLAHVISSATNQNGLKALYAAKSGISCALAILKADDSPGVTTLFELKSKQKQEKTKIEDICGELEKLSPCSLGKFKPLENCEFEIIDECGKIQLNSLPAMEKPGNLDKDKGLDVESLLKRYLDQFDLEKDDGDKGGAGKFATVYAILNWIDADDKNRGESGWDYSEDSSKNRPLYSLRELRLIEGFSPEDLSDLTEPDETNPEEMGNSGKTDRFDSIIENLTVFVTNDGKININTASLEVLMSLHEEMTEDMAAEIKAYRCGQAVNSAALKSTTWYDKDAHVDIKIPEELITTQSSLFRIVSTGSFGDLKKRVTAIVERRDETKSKMEGELDFRILSWQVE